MKGSHDVVRLNDITGETQNWLDSMRPVLTRHQHKVMRMYHWEGMTYNEIAQELGRGYLAVKRTLKRARKRIKSITHTAPILMSKCSICVCLRDRDNNTTCKLAMALVKMAAAGCRAEVSECAYFRPKDSNGGKA